MGFVVLLDANVLWSAAVRDTILRAVEADLFRPAWTEQILEELGRSLLRERPYLTSTQVAYLIDMLTQGFPEALVYGYEDLVPVMSNHEGDRHVLAAALRAGASVIVTSNLAHFDETSRKPYDIDLQTPDDFLCHLWHLSPETMARILREQAAALQNPPLTVHQVLETLARTAPQFAAIALRSGLLPTER
ncbi:MAG: PIN domain-containing protein [Chloroflexota bacterium]